MESLSDFPHWAVKLFGTIILFLLSMIFGSVPLKLSREENARRTPLRTLLISLSNCFAGGVFFSTVVLDLFPMVKRKMSEALESINVETKFPLGDFVIGFGFIFMLIMEQIVHSCCGENSVVNHGHSHNVNTDENGFLHHDETSHLLGHDDNDIDDDDAFDDHDIQSDVKQQIEEIHEPKKHVSLGHVSVLHGNSISDDENELEDSEESNRSVTSYETFYSHGGSHHEVRKMRKTKSLASVQSITQSDFRTYVLVFAISLHSLFEGLAVGLISEVQVLIQMFIALFIHKSIIAFSIGVQLVDAELPSKVVFICLMIFAAMAPLGVGLGIGVLKTSLDTTTKLFFSGVLQGIATGSFLYVTFFEVLPHELNIEDEKKPLKILFVLLGYTATTGLCYYENGFHSTHNINPVSPTLKP